MLFRCTSSLIEVRRGRTNEGNGAVEVHRGKSCRSMRCAEGAILEALHVFEVANVRVFL